MEAASYINLPQEMVKESFRTSSSRARVLIYGKIHSFTNAVGSCYATNAGLARQLGLSRRTVSNAIQSLKNDNMISQNKEMHVVTRYESQKNFDGGFFSVPEYILTEKFQVFGTKDERVRRLTKTEAIIFCFIKWHAEHNGKCEATQSGISEALDIGLRSVARALKSLKKSELIYNSEKAVNGSDAKRTIYTVNGSLIRMLEKKYALKKNGKKIYKGISSSNKSENKPQDDEKALREAFYSRVQNARENALRAIEDKLGSAYQTAGQRIRSLQIQIARADLSNDSDTLAKLQAEETKLKALRTQILIENHVSIPEYRCKKCSDTGFLNNGKLCDCYPG